MIDEERATLGKLLDCVGVILGTQEKLVADSKRQELEIRRLKSLVAGSSIVTTGFEVN